jgi:hypothetical protein
MTMRKYFLTTAIILSGVMSFSQPTVSMGLPKEFSFKKQPRFAPLFTDNGYYFEFKNSDGASTTHTLLSVDKSGNIGQVSELKITNGVFNNSYDIHGVYALGNKLFALVENPDKSAGLNRLSIRVIENGNITAKDISVGEMEFKKLMNQGNWHVAVTPDHRHLAVVGQMPRDKDEPNRYKYYFLDENFNSISKGELSFAGDEKRVFFNSFLASDKGDFYLIENQFEKGNVYPNVYKSSVNAPKGMIIAVQPSDGAQKIMSWATALNDGGDLILAGYYKKKSGFTVGDEEALGNWWYNLSTGQMKMGQFEKPVANMNARGLLKNGNTWFLIGEQYKADKETPTQQGQYLEENYNYKHNDALVTAFDETGAGKFNLTLSKTNVARNFDADLYPAFGILNGKLAVIYNDQYGKYFPKSSYDYYKLPVLVYINNDGLMEQPLHFEKELQTMNSSFTLYPQILNAGKNELMLLSGNGTNIRGVVFH